MTWQQPKWKRILMPTIAFMALCGEFQNIREVLTGKLLEVTLLSFMLFIAWAATTFIGLVALTIDTIKRSQELSLQQQSSMGVKQGIGKNLLFAGGVLVGASGILMYPGLTTRLFVLLGTLYGAGRIMNRYW